MNPYHPSQPAYLSNPELQREFGRALGRPAMAMGPAHSPRPDHLPHPDPQPFYSWCHSASSNYRPQSPLTVSMQQLVHQCVTSMFHSSDAVSPEAARPPHQHQRASRSPAPAPSPAPPLQLCVAAGAGGEMQGDLRGLHAAAYSSHKYSMHERRLSTDPFSALHLTTSCHAPALSRGRLSYSQALSGPAASCREYPACSTTQLQLPSSVAFRKPSSSMEPDTERSADMEPDSLAARSVSPECEPSESFESGERLRNVQLEKEMVLDRPTGRFLEANGVHKSTNGGSTAITSANASAEEDSAISYRTDLAGVYSCDCEDDAWRESGASHVNTAEGMLIESEGTLVESEEQSSSSPAWDRSTRRKRRPRPGANEEGAEEKLLCQICDDVSLGYAGFFLPICVSLYIITSVSNWSTEEISEIEKHLVKF